MRNDTKTQLAILCGALLAMGLAGCNRERDQMETTPSASTAAAATETAPTDTMADTMAPAPTDMPPSAVTSAADVTAEAPPSEGLGEPPSATTAAMPEAPMDNTETEQPPTDSNNPTR